MRVLVTGSRGFLGRNLTKVLRERGHHVIELDYTLGYDINNPHISERDTDVVIHLAALLTTQSDRFLNYLFGINVRGTLNMLEASIAANVPRFIFMSSSSVYDCLNQYAASKLAGEAYCRAASSLISTKIVRLFNAYGPGQSSRSGALVPRTIESLFKKAPVITNGDGKQTRDFVYVSDIVNVLIKEVEQDFLPRGEPVDLGTGVASSVNVVISRLQELFTQIVDASVKSELQQVALDEAREPRYSKANVPSELADVSWTSLDEGLEKTMVFWKDQVFRQREESLENRPTPAQPKPGKKEPQLDG